MKKALLATGAIVILLGTPMSVIALGKNEKGCLAGGAIGGIGGHLLGSSTTTTVLGAAAGCAVGTVVAKNKSEKQRSAQARERQRAKTARYAPRDERRVNP